MDFDDDSKPSVEEITPVTKCSFCIGIKCGMRLLAILGITFGVTCAAVLLLRDRKSLSISTVVLIVLLSIFVVVTVMFVVVSVLLLMAALDENPDLMSYYIWLTMTYLCMQLILAVAIPLVLVLDAKYPMTLSLIWLIIVMVVGLGWAHFISVVNSYKITLLLP